MKFLTIDYIKQHSRIDFDCEDQLLELYGDLKKGRKWFEYIKKNLPFDQLIWEKNPKTGAYWVHVSYVHPDFGRNRRQVIDGLLKK